MTTTRKLSLLAGVAACCAVAPAAFACPPGSLPPGAQATCFIHAAHLGSLSNTSPFVRKSDPADISNSIRMTLAGNGLLKSVTVGASPDGGGYIDYLGIDGAPKNYAEVWYGRGWQSDLRDFYHGGRYNPTQAGPSDFVGVPVPIVRGDGSLRIPRMRVPLFWTSKFDFTSREDIAPDDFPEDAGADADGFDEQRQWGASYSQVDEVRSEFDFAGEYADISARLPKTIRIPMLLHQFSYVYRHPPGAIRQFAGPGAVLPDKRPVLRTNRLLAHISPQSPGAASRPGPDDLSVAQLMWGLRLDNETASFNTVFMPATSSGAVWVKRKLTPGSRTLYDHSQRFNMGRMPAAVSGIETELQADDDGEAQLEADYLVLATGGNANGSLAIGLYHPPNGVNKRSVFGLDTRSGSIAYAENRTGKAKFLIAYMGRKGETVFSHLVRFSGLLNPDHEMLRGKATVEGVQQQFVVLFGTPNEIRKAVNYLESAGLDGQVP